MMGILGKKGGRKEQTVIRGRTSEILNSGWGIVSLGRKSLGGGV